MDVIDDTTSPSHVIPDLCNPSLLVSDPSPLPAISRIDWLRNAMSVWCASAIGEGAAAEAALLAR